MTKLNTAEDFLEWIQPFSDSLELDLYYKSQYSIGEEMLYLKDLVFKDLYLKSRHFECTEFRNCVFENCRISSSFIVSCTLIQCVFKNCEITWSKFLESDLIDSKFENCVIAGLELGDVAFERTNFINCSEILDLIIRGNWNRELSFTNCYIAHLDIEPIGEDNIEVIDFNECLIRESSFDRINFSKSKFINCSLSINQFSACTLSRSTLIEKNETPGQEYNLIDLRTILNSENQSIPVLQTIFGIHNADIKDNIFGLTSKIEFQSIFISYSFRDKEFANQINAELLRKGILTFLWEKDSPGGKNLEEIMTEGVKEKDRVLFIASKDSLKSAACHYELSAGRKKQETTWEEVLFPIHIDNYLFDVKKEIIRPRAFQEEYWQNIQELRNLNSLDFSEFTNGTSFDRNEYENLIFRLVKGLRKGK